MSNATCANDAPAAGFQCIGYASLFASKLAVNGNLHLPTVEHLRCQTGLPRFLCERCIYVSERKRPNLESRTDIEEVCARTGRLEMHILRRLFQNSWEKQTRMNLNKPFQVPSGPPTCPMGFSTVDPEAKPADCPF